MRGLFFIEAADISGRHVSWKQPPSLGMRRHD
jgi:hypothetical protein